MDVYSLIKRAHDGDKASRDQLLMENTGLIWSVVRRFISRGYEAEDLFQIGCIGMLKAIDRFDLSYNVVFSTYAVPMIAGEIRRFLRDDGIIKISRTIKEHQAKIINETEKYVAQNNCQPTLEELSKICGLEREDIIVAMEAAQGVESLYRSTNNERDDTELIDKIEDDTDIQSVVENRLFVKQLLNQLEEEQRKVIHLRYFQNKTQSETAKILGITQVKVSRMEKKIIAQLKRII